ncbi:hypothetical protein GDO81_027235 [Engystomops pustulosus]|uniref:Uncharacterized protein n=1 Tax=Engystomops pustulosus TaxID=76066 RepID=A0AAV6ZKN1_ENGPU|nr:hypothetical protein GDO81_027235 [Engystomops pustulosus]
MGVTEGQGLVALLGDVYTGRRLLEFLICERLLSFLHHRHHLLLGGGLLLNVHIMQYNVQDTIIRLPLIITLSSWSDTGRRQTPSVRRSFFPISRVSDRSISG